MHRCAQYFFRESRKGPPSLEEFLAFYDQAWISSGYYSTTKEVADKEIGRAILKKFWQLNNKNFKPALATEKWFTLDIKGIPFRGYIDKVDISSTGGLIILDYKSGKKAISKNDVEVNLQLSMYQLGARGIWLLPVEKLSLYHLRSNTTVEVDARDDSTLIEAEKTVVTVSQAIQSREFEPKLNSSCPCDYSVSCPLFNPSANPH